MTDVIEVSVRRPLRRPGHGSGTGEICIQTLIALRERMKVPASVTLVVYDRDGVMVRMPPTPART
jgi:hypothetical protein